MKKLIIKFQGGFGNQLFQFAISKKFEIIRNYQIIPDFNFYKNYKLHKNYIQYINFKHCGVISFLSSSFFPTKFLFLFKKYLAFFSYKFVKEKDTLDYINFYNFNYKKIYLDGYWQNIKYFYEIESQIKNLLNHFLKKNKKKFLVKKNFYKTKKNIVMIHLRLKDYKNTSNVNKHGLLSIHYYFRAIKILNQKKSNNKFIIFSDEVNLAKKKFAYLKEKIFFDEKNLLDPVTTMYYMTKCNDFIISNSTFSWWAAYLSKSINKNIIYPINWYTNKKFKNISCNNKWIKA